MNEHPSTFTRRTIFKTTTIFFDIRIINVLPGPKLMLSASNTLQPTNNHRRFFPK
ncbi:hypothetical protein PGB90_009252 [Kerria lacca]